MMEAVLAGRVVARRIKNRVAFYPSVDVREVP